MCNTINDVNQISTADVRTLLKAIRDDVNQISTTRIRILIETIKKGESKDIRDMAKLIINERIDELNLDFLYSYIRNLPKDERKPYLDLLDTRIGFVNFKNYYQISKLSGSPLTEINKLITDKFNYFFEKILVKDLTFDQLLFLTIRNPETKAKRMFCTLLKKRGLSIKEKKELSDNYSKLNRFLLSFIKEEMDEKKALISRFSDAVYNNDKEEIKKIMEILSKQVDK